MQLCFKKSSLKGTKVHFVHHPIKPSWSCLHFLWPSLHISPHRLHSCARHICQFVNVSHLHYIHSPQVIHRTGNICRLFRGEMQPKIWLFPLRIRYIQLPNLCSAHDTLCLYEWMDPSSSHMSRIWPSCFCVHSWWTIESWQWLRNQMLCQLQQPHQAKFNSQFTNPIKLVQYIFMQMHDPLLKLPTTSMTLLLNSNLDLSHRFFANL